jgi:hypothetical protein
MVADGEALKAGYGKYAHRDNEHLVPQKKPRKKHHPHEHR